MRQQGRIAQRRYARAIAISRTALGAPLQAFARDEVFDHNGFAQIQVSFLGQRIVLGCVEGEEDLWIKFAHDFEIYAGEVLKAVAGLDDARAALMAGSHAMERIAELEGHDNLPASDRTVALDHNSADYLEAIVSLDRLILIVRTSNIFLERDPADHERRLAELEAGRKLLESKLASVSTLRAVLLGTLAYLATKFADAPIGEAATAAWNALKALVGAYQ